MGSDLYMGLYTRISCTSTFAPGSGPLCSILLHSTLLWCMHKVLYLTSLCIFSLYSAPLSSEGESALLYSTDHFDRHEERDMGIRRSREIDMGLSVMSGDSRPGATGGRILVQYKNEV